MRYGKGRKRRNKKMEISKEEEMKRRDEWKETLKKLDKEDIVHLFDTMVWAGLLTAEQVYKFTDEAYDSARMKWECD